MKMFSWFLVVLLMLGLTTGVMAQDDEDEYEKDFIEVAIYCGGAIPMGGLTDWTISNEASGSEELGAKFGYDVGFDVGHDVDIQETCFFAVSGLRGSCD